MLKYFLCYTTYYIFATRDKGLSSQTYLRAHSLLFLLILRFFIPHTQMHQKTQLKKGE